LELPAANDKLIFRVYDHDPGPIPDDLVASMQFSIKDIIETVDIDDQNKPRHGDARLKMRWVNLFGCNPKYSGKRAD